MKKLILLRHAKSSWNETNLDDIDRPLSKRGIYSAQLMRVFIQTNYKKDISLIYSSLSKRTKSTCEIVFQNKIKINYDKRLYTFNHQDLLAWIKKKGVIIKFF